MTASSENFGFSDVERTDGRELTYLQAISEGLRQAMEADQSIVVMGEDVGGEFGGAFKVTKGLAAEFGKRRVMNMPMTELAFVGAANGMALMGLRPVVEMQFADFISSAFDSIVQFASTAHYRWGAAIPWVIRAPADGGIRSGPFHSQNPEAWFCHTPGLKVVAPATPADAKGLLLAAIVDDNPVIFFESKPLYRSVRGTVPEAPDVVPLGVARLAREGTDVSVITYGAMVYEALRAAEALEREVSVEVIDLRTLKPLDIEAVLRSARKTGKVVVAHAATRLAGFGAEIVAEIAERAFEYLDAPISRIGGLDTPVPFSPPLEDAYRPDAAVLTAAIQELAGY